MTQTKRSKSVGYIYAFGITWLLFALMGIPLYDGYDVIAMFVIAAGVSGIVFFISSVIRKFSGKNDDSQEASMPTVAHKSASAGTGNAELDAVIDEGLALLYELRNASQNIKNKDIVRETDEIIDISHKIIEKLKRQPQLLSSAKRFFNYYLPTTTKLITNYSYMESQGVTGENISNTMQKIENSLATLSDAYRKQLDTLFSSTSTDLESDIDALEQILKKEGLVQNKFKGER